MGKSGYFSDQPGYLGRGYANLRELPEHNPEGSAKLPEPSAELPGPSGSFPDSSADLRELFGYFPDGSILFPEGSAGNPGALPTSRRPPESSEIAPVNRRTAPGTLKSSSASFRIASDC